MTHKFLNQGGDPYVNCFMDPASDDFLDHLKDEIEADKEESNQAHIAVVDAGKTELGQSSWETYCATPWETRQAFEITLPYDASWTSLPKKALKRDPPTPPEKAHRRRQTR